MVSCADNFVIFVNLLYFYIKIVEDLIYTADGALEKLSGKVKKAA